MIILITGTPGSGKTLFTVADLLRGQFKDRPLYINNIPNLLLEHHVFSGDETENKEDDVFNWFDGRVPPGGVIVIDEVQRVFRPRSSTAAVPPWIARLETHRHLGVDFIVITQHPMLLDANVRRLVGRHIHVRRMWGLSGAAIYEWDHCSNNTQAVKQAQFRSWKYPKDAYQLYKSSELHTKAGARVPTIVKFLLVGLIAAPIFWYYGAKRVYERFTVTPEIVTTAATEGALKDAASSKSTADPDRLILTPAQYLASLNPRLPSLAYSAPRYDRLTEPRRAPVPAACVSSKSQGCKCYTQDATPYTTTKDFCERVVAGGIFIDFDSSDQTKGPVASTNGALKPGVPSG